MRINRIIVGAVAIFVTSFITAAQQRRPGDQQRPGQRAIPAMTQPQTEEQSEKAPVHHPPPPPPVEKTEVTHHSARVGGQEINYTATAGTYVIKDDQGNPKATFFYVAYTKDGLP
ncbi:MAG TPA: hypothetical protein VJN90_08610, partial [Candidatus Acidoferrales bacterium]|nr:hypothetical protein [Candidatus Acidoferrales bacterium]